jgi:hypothetical protein
LQIKIWILLEIDSEDTESLQGMKTATNHIKKSRFFCGWRSKNGTFNG